MDHLPSDKVAGVRETLEAAGTRVVYLRPYLPDLNPIEMALARLKARSDKAAERTIPRIGELIDAFAPQECCDYFKHAGYA